MIFDIIYIYKTTKFVSVIVDACAFFPRPFRFLRIKSFVPDGTLSLFIRTKYCVFDFQSMQYIHMLILGVQCPFSIKCHTNTLIFHIHN